MVKRMLSRRKSFVMETPLREVYEKTVELVFFIRYKGSLEKGCLNLG